jgi:hypothetical protein
MLNVAHSLRVTKNYTVFEIAASDKIFKDSKIKKSRTIRWAKK